ncbi:HPP family-domain-containing protein [Phaeosphaeriaceae sp. PMI808]|nr:HPP family-domain-containing protein [Phaeosphaeriaceae sp. PMI808]
MPPPDPLVPLERYIQTGLAKLPLWLSRWLGFRGKPLPPSPTWMICLYGFIGAFGGLSIIIAIFAHTEYFTVRLVPPIVASFGASAILCYGAIDVPLAQPRSLIFGHFLSGLTGVIIATTFQFNLQDDPFPRLQWLAASLATAIALVVMHLTKSTHPPAGATALLPCIDPHIWALRWYFLPVLLLSSAIVLVTALTINNIQRQYPKFWVAQIPPPSPPKDDPHRHRKLPVAKDSSIGSPRSALRDLESGPL